MKCPLASGVVKKMYLEVFKKYIKLGIHVVNMTGNMHTKF
jgi:hypothetical protein